MYLSRSYTTYNYKRKSNKIPLKLIILAIFALSLLITFSLYRYFTQYNSLIKEANSAYNIKRYSTAQNLSSSAIHINPNRIEAYEINGNSLFEKHDYKNAIDSFFQAYNLDNKNVPVLIGIGKSYAALNQYNNAIKYIDMALFQNSKNIDALLNKAFVLSKQNKNDDAIEIYNNVISIDFKNINAHIQKSNILLNISDIKNAEIETNIALNIDSNNKYAIYNSAYINILQGKKIDSTKKLENLLYSLDRNTSDNLLLIGNIYSLLNNSSESIKAYDNSILLDPNCFDAYIYKAMQLLINEKLTQDDLKTSKKILEKISLMDSTSQYFLFLKGAEEFHNKNEDLALEYFNKSIQVNPNNFKLYNLCGKLLSNNNLFEKSLTFYTLSSEKTNNIEAFEGKAFCYFNLGNKGDNYSKALNSYLESIKLNTSNPMTFINIGIILNGSKKYSDALYYLEIAENMKIENSEMYYNLALAYHYMQNSARAIECIIKAESSPKRNEELIKNIYALKSKILN